MVSWAEIEAGYARAIEEIRECRLGGGSQAEKRITALLLHPDSNVRSYALGTLVTMRPTKHSVEIVAALLDDYSPAARDGAVFAATEFLEGCSARGEGAGAAKQIEAALATAALYDPFTRVRSHAMNALRNLARPGDEQAKPLPEFPYGREWETFEDALLRMPPERALQHWLDTLGVSRLAEYWKRRTPHGFDRYSQIAGVNRPHILHRVLTEQNAMRRGETLRIALAGIALDYADHSSCEGNVVRLAVQCWRDNLDWADELAHAACLYLFEARGLVDLADYRSEFLLNAFRQTGLET